MSGLDAANTPVDLADVFVKERSDLAASGESKGGVELMGAYAALTDDVVSRILDIAIEEAETDARSVARSVNRRLAVAAVGGYGREEMSPYSDVDVVFLVEKEGEEEVEACVKRAFRLLMDTVEKSGLTVGYSYRRIDDLEHVPFETLTSFLDARLIAGSAAVFSAFTARLAESLMPADFVIRHVEARRGANGSDAAPYVIAPNIKEGCGALRDIHTARWIARVAVWFQKNGEWRGLRGRGVLSDREVESVEEAREFLSKLRNAIHLLAGRELDVLSAERHKNAAQRLGFASVDQFFAKLYKHLGTVRWVLKKTVGACVAQPLEIEPGVTATNGKLEILDRGLLARDDDAVLRMFRHAQTYSLGLSCDAADLLADAARKKQFALSAGRVLLDILIRPKAAMALRQMADLGVLDKVLPGFDNMMWRVPGDAVHRFTVGEHCLRTVERVESLLGGEDPRFADVVSRIEQVDVLVLSALLHDIGKISSQGDHSETGAAMARELAARIGMPQEECAAVEFLVRNHLLLSETARTRDIRVQTTIDRVLENVDKIELLDLLLLLTVADYRAMGTSEWSQVQIRLLLELHQRVHAALRLPGAASPNVERHRKRVQKELRLANIPDSEIEEHFAALSATYLLNTPSDELAAHISYVRAVKHGSPSVDIKDYPGDEFTQLTAVCADRPGLLSEISGVLYALGIGVHLAHIFTRRAEEQIAIDKLYIDFEGHRLSETKKWQLEGELIAVLSGESTVHEVLARLNLPEPKQPENISVLSHPNASDDETVLEVRARDTAGLLYYFTRAIAGLGWNIHSARIATWGYEARDTFYLTDENGDKVRSGDAKRLVAVLNSSASE